MSNFAGTLNDFSTTIPTTGGRVLWISTVLIASRDTSFTFSGLVGSTPRILSTDGFDGVDGPGVVFRGSWDNTKQYFRTAQRADVIIAGGIYYVALVNNTNTSPLNTQV